MLRVSFRTGTGPMPQTHGGTSNRGFASMDRERQREIASKGGRSVPKEARGFSRNPELAAEAGRKGGQTSQSRRVNSHHAQQDDAKSMPDAKPIPDDDTGGEERKPN